MTGNEPACGVVRAAYKRSAGKTEKGRAVAIGNLHGFYTACTRFLLLPKNYNPVTKIGDFRRGNGSRLCLKQGGLYEHL